MVDIKFAVKDARQSLITAIDGILKREPTIGMPPLTYSAGGYIVRCTTRQRDLKGVAVMNLRFNVTSAGRKALANAVGEIIGCNVVYDGVPSFTYTVGDFIIDREGTLVCPANADRDEAVRLITALAGRGYTAEPMPDYHDLRLSEREELGLGRDRRDPPGEDGPHPSNVPDTDSDTCGVDDADTLTVSMPIEGFSETSLENFKAIIRSKDRLIKKALGADSLHFHRSENELRFPWFTLTGIDGEMDAYVRFVTALCKMAKGQKRIVAKEREEENEKLAMRLFLVRLGFVGPELKVARAILLRNLSGNSAWKSGTPPTRATADPVSVATQMIPCIGGTQDEKQ